MSYAGSRVMRDADSHLMELPDFLARNVESSMRAAIPSLEDIRLADVRAKMRELEGARGHSQETVDQLVALGDNLTRGPKWHGALGAFNGGGTRYSARPFRFSPASSVFVILCNEDLRNYGPTCNVRCSRGTQSIHGGVLRLRRETNRCRYGAFGRYGKRSRAAR